MERTKSVIVSLLVCFLVALPASGSPRSTGLLQRLARILGLTAAPGQMRDGDSDSGPGRLWIADVEGGTRRAITTDGGYRWPLFEPGGEAVIALKGPDVVRIPLAGGGAPRTLGRQPSVEKLVAFDADHPDDVLVIKKAAPPFALLSLSNGVLHPLPAPQGKDEQKMLSYARGEERQVGKLRLGPKSETRMAMEGKVTWQNVYLQDGDGPPRNISHCEEVSCHQPALSPDARRVVYVEATPAAP